MRPSHFALTLLSGLALTLPANAGPTRARHAIAVSYAGRDVRFLGLAPIGPLTRVRDGHIEEPEPHACQSWGPVGSRWRELDSLGQVAGVVKVSARSYYDYTRCNELEVTRISGRKGAGIYVDAHATYHAPSVTRWHPDDAAIAALGHLANERQKGITNLDLSPSGRVPFAKRTLFFAWTPTSDRYAVVGGRSLLVLVLRKDRWKVVHETKPPKMRAVDRGYAAVAVTDMDADGLPDLVVHNLEGGGEWYGDSTLSLRASGLWTWISAGISGSTA